MGYRCSGGSASKADTCFLPAASLTLNEPPKLTTSILTLTYNISPPPVKAFTEEEIRKVFSVKSNLNNLGFSYFLYILQDPDNRGKVRLIFDFQGSLPVIASTSITVEFLISNPVAISTETVSFLSPALTGMNSRSFDPDLLK